MYSHHKLGHQWDDSPPPQVSYIVCALPRSGSSLLCDILAATELAGAPTEYFDDNQRTVFARHWNVARDAREYLDAMIARKTSPNGVFGLKAFIGHLRDRDARFRSRP